MQILNPGIDLDNVYFHTSIETIVLLQANSPASIQDLQSRISGVMGDTGQPLCDLVMHNFLWSKTNIFATPILFKSQTSYSESLAYDLFNLSLLIL